MGTLLTAPPVGSSYGGGIVTDRRRNRSGKVQLMVNGQWLDYQPVKMPGTSPPDDITVGDWVRYLGADNLMRQLLPTPAAVLAVYPPERSLRVRCSDGIGRIVSRDAVERVPIFRPGDWVHLVGVDCWERECWPDGVVATVTRWDCTTNGRERLFIVTRESQQGDPNPDPYHPDCDGKWGYSVDPVNWQKYTPGDLLLSAPSPKVDWTTEIATITRILGECKNAPDELAEVALEWLKDWPQSVKDSIWKGLPPDVNQAVESAIQLLGSDHGIGEN